ncbi:MAG: 4-amino-4-deoxy-L-arabinose transferase and related glycosyltransferases of PMT family [Phormidesmis priestleyi Ana]|uniref:4-amino-4-deoxy-L-arabinose transferase and related glycosyltransferases of PMT family n=1 Tax=Phormidesmis priestleyi Ana TaxID=1666911 RepID=A0A0N8KNK8_9CYAN|nr:MAG: 4-amino-4-deoxy-L-arabinose transferase and related glycosyltransferases of PMT family [Phormidesmis priestleyi Ana]
MLLSKITASRNRLTTKLISPMAWVNPPLLLVITTLGLFAGLRLVHLSADFPVGISSYGMTYSDEGWWSRNAIALVREGQWYIDDGYNTIFNLPVLPLIQAAWFKIFGVSLVAARSITVLSVIATSALVYVIANADPRPNTPKSGLTWLAPFIVLSSYPVFVYSRLALLELPMMGLILMSLWLAIASSSQPSADFAHSAVKRAKIIGSAIFFALAVLTKTSALFALPLMLAMLCLQPGKRQQKVQTLLIWLLTFSLVAGLYTYIYSHGEYALSYGHFSGYNVTGKMHRGLFSIIKGPLRVLKYSFELFPLMLSCLLISLLTLVRSPAYRSNQSFQIAAIWSVSALAAFSTSNYAAPRYFLIWIVPAALAIPLAIEYFLNHPSWKKNLLITLFSLSIVISLGRIVYYLSTPQFTLVNMADQVSATIEANPDHPPIVMGHFADTLALVSNIKTINDRMGYRELDYRIETFNPGYYISVGEVEPSIIETIDTYYKKELLQTFDVYQNYDYGVPVHFYRLDAYDWWQPSNRSLKAN